MADLIKTVEDGDEPSDFSEASASEDEFQPTKKRMKTGSTGGFNADFEFGQYGRDIWSEKQEALKLKTKKRTTLDEKINRRAAKIKQKNGDVGVDTGIIEVKSESESEASDDEDEDEKSDGESNEDEDDIDSDDSISHAGPKSKLRKGIKKSFVRDDEDSNDDIDLSEDELQRDEIRERAGSSKKNKKNKKAKKVIEEEEEEDDDELIGEDDERLEANPNEAFETDLSFQQMNLSRPLMKAITALGFVHPTPIQAAAIPVALTGRDICGCAATGTGKTAAYMLPVLERLLYKPKAEVVTRVLCLVPTRELGVQVYNVTKNLASFSSDIQVGLAVGGLDVQSQEAVLRQSPDIVIATPGRLIDHLGNTPSFTLDSIEILILDEADRMLDEWFAEQLKEIVKQCSPRRQTLLFSATMTDSVKDLATVSLKNPSKIFVDSNKQVAFNLRQQFVRVRNESDRDPILCSLVVRTFHSKTMIFVPTKKVAHRLHILLGLMGIRIGELHGDMSQLQRLDSLKKFQHGEIDVLIVTDVAARGLDIPGVLSVLNYAMPPTLEQYIHRCGRTARAGRTGVAVSLVGEQDRKLMKAVAKSATLPVKSRVIPPEIIPKYRDKLKALESEVESVLAEELADKSIARAEIETNKAIKMLESGQSKRNKKRNNPGDDKKRVWFQSSKDRKNEKEKLKSRAPGDVRKLLAQTAEDKKLKRLTEFQARNAKRKRKPNRDGGMELVPNNQGGSKKNKRKSNFDDELTNTKRAREFRHQPRSFKPGNKNNKSDRKNNMKMNKRKK